MGMIFYPKRKMFWDQKTLLPQIVELLYMRFL
jgi:hypothetical protein